MVDICHYTFSKPIECLTGVNPNVNYGLWVVIMSQYRFINYNKCINEWMLIVGERLYLWDGERGGTGGIWQFCSFHSVLL